MTIYRSFPSLIGIILCSFLQSSVLAQDRLNHEFGRTAVIEKTSSNLTLPAAIPVQRNETSKESDSIGTTSGTLGLVVLVFVVGFVYFRFTKPKMNLRSALFGDEAHGKALKLVRQLPLTPKHSLHLVQWNDKEILLACADGAITVIGEAPTIIQSDLSDKLTTQNVSGEDPHVS